MGGMVREGSRDTVPGVLWDTLLLWALLKACTRGVIGGECEPELLVFQSTQTGLLQLLWYGGTMVEQRVKCTGSWWHLHLHLHLAKWVRQAHTVHYAVCT